MIDPTELSGLCEQLRKRLRYYREDLNQVYIDCVEVATLDAVLDENAALRVKVAEAEKALDLQETVRKTRQFAALESRLAALREAGETVMKMNAPTPCSGCEMCRAWDAFKAELRSDP